MHPSRLSDVTLLTVCLMAAIIGDEVHLAYLIVGLLMVRELNER